MAATPAEAQTRSFNVPAQSAMTGIPEFARQADVQILVSESVARGRNTRAVRGRLPVRQALDRLLAGTGLRVSSGDGRTFTLSAGGTPQGENQAGNAAADSESDAERGASEILVVGSRSQNVDIRRTEDDTQPYVVFDRNQLVQSQATSVDEFLRTRLPMNSSISSRTQSGSSGVEGSTSSINLRGLGENQTLILIDGRRVPNKTAGPAPNQGDINGIPISAIERIEILPSTASGIYGGGATGGVINIITRRDYQGFEATALYGVTARGDAPRYQLGLSGSFNLNEGRTRISFSASRRENDGLLNGERDFANLARNLQFINNPDAYYTATTPPLGSTTNIRSQNGSNLVLRNGTALNSPRTFIPTGYSGVTTDSGAALVANAGRYNLGLPPGQNGAERSLLGANQVTELNGSVRQQVGANLELFANATWTSNNTQNRGVPLTSSVTLLPTAPNNPFTTPINVSFTLPGVVTYLRSQVSSLSISGGGILHLSPRLTIALDNAWARSRAAFQNTSPIFNSSLTAALQNGTVDVMRDLAGANLNLSPYLLPSPNALFGPSNVVTNDTTLRATGSLLRLPADWVRLTGILQRRQETYDQTFSMSMNAAGTTSTFFVPRRTQNINSAYVEATIPVVSNRMHIPAVYELDLQGSVRYDHYSTSSAPTNIPIASASGPLPSVTYTDVSLSATSYTLAMRYKPIRDLQFRASYGTGFLPPNVLQTTATTPTQTSLTLIDPRRGSISALVGPFQFINGGGGPNLRPENSRSWSVGAVFSPTFIPNLRVSLDYTNIRKTNEIRGVTAQDVLNLESVYPDRVTRAPLSAQDQALGYTGGVITAIDGSNINIARKRVEAWDLQFDYSLDTSIGRIAAFLVATYEPKFIQQTLPSTAPVNIAGFAEYGPERRAAGGLSWNNGPFTLAWSTQYIGSYKVTFATVPSASPSLILNQGSDHLPAQWYHDVLFSFRMPDSSTFLRRARIDLGVQNLFDSRPPITATTSLTGTYSSLADVRLRRFTAAITLPF